MSAPLSEHRLAKLLMPESVALVGASPKEGTVGNGMLKGLREGGFRGRIYPINPNYKEVEGIACYPSLAGLPERVDHALLGVANARLEAAMAEAVAAGVRAASILASGYLEGDASPPLTRRIADLARGAGLQLCGGNGMGFYNHEARVRICGFPPPDWVVPEPGPMALVAHSGSVFSALVHNDRRFSFSLAVSAGQELVTTAADYLDFALRMESTKVVGLFLETIRDPAQFVAGLALANARDIPVVMLKVGRSPESAALAVSHSGALVGDDAVQQALFRRHGVIALDTLDEFANALLLLAQPRRIGPGNLASMHDSGGLRELLADRAAAQKVPFARIGETTRQRLAARLDYGLDPVNPLDAWGTGHDWEGIFTDCMSALVDDPDTAIGALCVETRSGRSLHEGYARMMQTAHGRNKKPLVVINNMAALGNDELAVRINSSGIPLLIGLDPALAAIRGEMARRDFRARPAMRPWPAPSGAREKWRRRLSQGTALDESESLLLLADYAVPVLPHRSAENAEAAVAAAKDLGFPVVLKTAMAGILHKSDVGGVKLGLGDGPAVRQAYEEMARRLGPRVLLAPMASGGIEMGMGAKFDPQFGPVVMVGVGGVLIEFMTDRACALAPFDEAEAARLIDGLALRPLLDGKRGRPPADIAGLCAALARFSTLAADLAGLVGEIDVNPLLAGDQACVALDALIVPVKVK
jgi:acyl-CoA synthetase (NDP forming)